MGAAFRVAPSLLIAGFLTIMCCGCETTAQTSAALEKAAKHERLALQGVSVTAESPSVKVLDITVLHAGAETAVVVALRNSSSRALENAPIEITVRDAHGSVLYENNQPGDDPSLTKVPLLEPGATTIWVDDQVQASGTPASASALVGDGAPAPRSVPRLIAAGVHATGEGSETGAAGTVANRSNVSQQHVVVDVLARKGSRIVAAGRALLPEVAPDASVPFQVYFVGNPSGARIEASAPPTTF
jgi:hypothetical protein